MQHDTLHQAVHHAGRLVNVRGALLSKEVTRISAVELVFESLTITFSVDSEFDTIIASSLPLSSEELICPAVQPFWEHCLGKRLQWAWRLTNQQGYEDGIRFGFQNTDESDYAYIELIAAASSFDFFTVNRVEV